MSSRLSKTGNRFKTKLRKEDGSSFYGQILDIPDTSRVSNFLSARRYLRVNPNSTIIPGDIISGGSIKYIVATHAEGFHLGPIYRHFKLFEVDKILEWKKKSFVENPVTGIKEMTLSDEFDKVYLSLQPSSDISDSIRIPQETFIALSNIRVERDEIIEGYTVTKLNEVLGIYLLELKEI